jgi:hypothetical protein
MRRFVEGADRGHSTLLPECLDDWVEESNPVRVIDAFVDALDLAKMGFDGSTSTVISIVSSRADGLSGKQAEILR